MARMPCTCHGTRHPGPPSYVYPAIATGSTVERTPLRLCPAGSVEYLQELETRLVVDDLEAEHAPELLTCCACGQDLGQFWGNPVWVTEYLDGDRRDWYGRAHQGCVSAVREQLVTQFLHQRPLGAPSANGTAAGAPIGHEPGKPKKQTFSRQKTSD